ISHRGRLVCGRLGDAAVVTMDGRCHVYEGYSLEQITLPIHVMRRLGAQLLIASNACGGLNPKFATGDVMVVADHINLLGRTPLAQWCDGAFGRHSASPYDSALIEQALAVARRENFAAFAGTYIA